MSFLCAEPGGGGSGDANGGNNGSIVGGGRVKDFLFTSMKFFPAVIQKEFQGCSSIFLAFI